MATTEEEDFIDLKSRVQDLEDIFTRLGKLFADYPDVIETPNNPTPQIPTPPSCVSNVTSVMVTPCVAVSGPDIEPGSPPKVFVEVLPISGDQNVSDLRLDPGQSSLGVQSENQIFYVTTPVLAMALSSAPSGTNMVATPSKVAVTASNVVVTPSKVYKMDGTPSKMDVTPAKVVVTPSKMNVTPSKMDVTSSRVVVTPSKIDVTPSKMDVTPSKMDVTPSKMDVTPAKVVVTPSKMDVTPSKMDVTPSKVVATTSKMDVTTSKVVVTPSKMDVTPAKVVVTRSKMDVTTSKVVVTTSKKGVTLSKMDVTPSKVVVAPSKMDVTPSKMDVTPKVVVTPSKMDVTPSKVVVTPSKVVTPKVVVTASKVAVTPKAVVTPSKAAVTPSKAAVTPSKLTLIPKVVLTPCKVILTPCKVVVTPCKVVSAEDTGPGPPPTKVHPMSADLNVSEGGHKLDQLRSPDPHDLQSDISTPTVLIPSDTNTSPLPPAQESVVPSSVQEPPTVNLVRENSTKMNEPSKEIEEEKSLSISEESDEDSEENKSLSISEKSDEIETGENKNIKQKSETNNSEGEDEMIDVDVESETEEIDDKSQKSGDYSEEEEMDVEVVDLCDDDDIDDNEQPPTISIPEFEQPSDSSSIPDLIDIESPPPNILNAEPEAFHSSPVPLPDIASHTPINSANTLVTESRQEVSTPTTTVTASTEEIFTPTYSSLQLVQDQPTRNVRVIQIKRFPSLMYGQNERSSTNSISMVPTSSISMVPTTMNVPTFLTSTPNQPRNKKSAVIIRLGPNSARITSGIVIGNNRNTFPLPQGGLNFGGNYSSDGTTYSTAGGMSLTWAPRPNLSFTTAPTPALLNNFSSNELEPPDEPCSCTECRPNLGVSETENIQEPLTETNAGLANMSIGSPNWNSSSLEETNPFSSMTTTGQGWMTENPRARTLSPARGQMESMTCPPPRKRSRKQNLTTTSDFNEAPNPPDPEISFYKVKKIKRIERSEPIQNAVVVEAVAAKSNDVLHEVVPPPPPPPPPPLPLSPSEPTVTVPHKKFRLPILDATKVPFKLRKNHFTRYAEVRRNQEKGRTITDLANQSNVFQKVTGWRLLQLTSHVDQIVESEESVGINFDSLLAMMEVKFGPNFNTRDLERIQDLLKGNIQRCKELREQMSKSRLQLAKILDDKSSVHEILTRFAHKDTEALPPSAAAKRGRKNKTF